MNHIAPATRRNSHQDTSSLTSGAYGREIFFRPNRYDVKALEPLTLGVRVCHHGTSSEASLRNLSQSGLAVSWPEALSLPTVGDLLDEVQVVVDGTEFVRASAKVCTLQSGRTVGLELQGTLLQVDGLLAAQQVAARARGRSIAALEAAPWRGLAADAFKARVAELGSYLRDSKRLLGQLEAELGWDTVHAGDQTLPNKALIDLVARNFTPEILRFVFEIDAARREAGVDSDGDKLLEAYSRSQVHAEMIEAPWMRRALEKPFGYPGDYELMRYVYERPFEGPTLFAKAMAYSFLQTPAACAVRERKNLVMREISALFERHPGGPEPIRLLSIAAGPAQEIFELLSERTEMPAPVEIVLFEQDASALAYAYGRIRTVVDQRWRGRVSVRFLHEGIRALIKNPELFNDVGTFDGIICCGLYDYLGDEVAAGLTAKLHGVLRPGGTVWIGNMVPENPCRWFMEHHQDWRLRYRSRQQILDFAMRGVPTGQHVILEEPTGVNPFVAVSRR